VAEAVTASRLDLLPCLHESSHAVRQPQECAARTAANGSEHVGMSSSAAVSATMEAFAN
jgi:hypothetical protein